jgi:hypothetical protein
MINTRQELIDALHEASEIEHGLMLQYLFTALTMKKFLNEGITGEQQELIRKWEGSILRVARQEMAHLGTVCNLLSAIGGSPHFERPNFPQREITYYPFSFNLTRFSDESLYRFIRFELPKGEPIPTPPLSEKKLFGLQLLNVVPDPLEYDYIGELYNKIKEGFNKVLEKDLFIGPISGQEEEEWWSDRVSILLVKNKETANKAIDSIIKEGEGSPTNREGSHYNVFLNIRKDLYLQLKNDPNFDPARPVVSNPRTREHRDSPMQGTMIKKRETKKIAELFNGCYNAVLLMLSQLYSHGGESKSEREILRQSSRHMMTMCIRPFAEILTIMPITEDPVDGTAGPPFEIYGPLQLSTQKDSRWMILNEQLTSLYEEANNLSFINSRLKFISDNIFFINNNIQNVLLSEKRL